MELDADMTDSQVFENIAAAVAENTETTAATNTVAATGYIKCSLCNHIIDEEAAHLATEHAHLGHIHEMLTVPLPPPSSDECTVQAVGLYAVSVSQSADRGPAAFRVVQRAQQQLHRLLDGVQNSNGFVYAFGSVVSMGCWDGAGDADFAFIDPKWYYVPAVQDHVIVVEDEKEEEEEESDNNSGAGEGTERTASDTPAATTAPQHHWDVENDAAEEAVSTAAAADVAESLHSRVISPEREKTVIRSVTARLRDIGFRFDELDPVLHTRIPVVRRKRPAHAPLDLRAMQQDHHVRICFDKTSAETQFRSGRLHTFMDDYGAREVGPQRGDQLVLAVPDGCDAVHLMSRRERIPGVRKMWQHNQRTPEIFAIDFDLSCRYHGIRNSWLLRRYLEQDEVFRMGNVFLKKWSKACGINNSRVGFLTSYAISVLWVYFLLRRNAVAFVAPDDVPLLPDPAAQGEIPYVPLWPPLGDAAADAARTTRLGALLRDFFYFYGEEFDWATQVVTIRQACLTEADVRTKADLGWLTDNTASLLLRERSYHGFSIEDVYEDDLDLGRHLTPDKAAWSRLQFRLAYTRCAGQTAEVHRLLDVPQKRAAAVLRARLFRHLLVDTEDAGATVADVLPGLCPAATPWPGEDPAYLLSTYELGNRLSDLWYDADRVAQDVANHKRYDRRANQFIPPPNPTTSGEWAVVCSDPLPADAAGAWERWVRLEPPVAAHRESAKGAPRRQRQTCLQKECNQCAEMTRLFGIRGDGEGAAKPSVLGLLLSKTSKEAVYPHCFYVLHTHRFFDTYDAREVFVQCLEDVAWELARLHEVRETAEEKEAEDALTNRERLFTHLTAHLHAAAATQPGYAALLHFIVVVSTDYVVFQGIKGVSLLRPTHLLLQIVGAAGEAPVVAARPSPPPAAAAAAHSRGKAQNKPRGAQRGQKPAASSLPLRMNPEKVVKGRCGECKRTQVLIYPSNQPDRDPGLYCADCWSNY